MTYAEMQQAGRKLKANVISAQLRQLALDPCFVAMVAWIDRNVDAWQQTFAGQQLAGKNGELAHAAGSLHTILLLRAQLENTVKPPRPKAATPADNFTTD